MTPSSASSSATGKSRGTWKPAQSSALSFGTAAGVMRCILLAVRRIQLHMDEDLDEALGRLATERGVPKAVLIREVLRTAVPTRRPDDPSSGLIGIYEGEESESEIVNAVVYSP